MNSLKSCLKNQSGFTLLELIITMAMIGVLAGMFVVKYPGVQKQARDTQRKSDFKQYQNLLEVYAGNHGGIYPGRSSGVNATTVCTDVGQTGCVSDPKGTGACKTGACGYNYMGNGCNDGTACATQYFLYGRLEDSDGFWVVCSNGKSGQMAESTDFATAAGNCPLP